MALIIAQALKSKDGKGTNQESGAVDLHETEVLPVVSEKNSLDCDTRDGSTGVGLETSNIGKENMKSRNIQNPYY